MKPTTYAAMLIAVAGLLLAAPRAEAAAVQYSTTGTFSISGTSTGTFLTDGGVGFQDFLQFNGVSNITANVGAAPVTSSLGNLFVGVITGTELTPTGTFTLTINQTTPGPGTESFSPAALSGTLSRTGGGGPESATGEIVVTFAQPSITIDGVQYSIEGLGQNGLAANQLGLGLYGNKLNFSLSTTAVPEPGLLALVGAVFGTLVFVAYRRRNGVAGDGSPPPA